MILDDDENEVNVYHIPQYYIRHISNRLGRTHDCDVILVDIIFTLNIIPALIESHL